MISDAAVPAVPAGRKAQSGRVDRLLGASDAGHILCNKQPDRGTAGATGARTGRGGQRPPRLGHRHPRQRVDLHHGGGRAGKSARHHLGVQEPQAEECG